MNHSFTGIYQKVDDKSFGLAPDGLRYTMLQY
ncbi:hypothetical protein DFR56_103345 [Pseudogracilibacillus auburnensis]|uniref:Uncharacterized protein n=1 Tax=Pseudogracilibacillus auburnensis TaxID=1494959 RepID=A0A2V3WJ90_9BACI|nr:hypothetical protein DFR56_103345 [Pseudogracilibacillus auburnensis]